MPDEAEKSATDAAEAGKHGAKKSKLPTYVGSGVVLVGGMAAAAWYLGLGPFAGGPPRHAAATAAIEEEADHGGGGEHGEETKAGSILAFEPFIANLADEGGRRYLKATFQIDFGKGPVPASVQPHLPQIRDLLLTLFTSKTFDDIRTPEGKQQLREEIIARVNQVLDRDLVKAVYFTEFIVQ